jgi:hypothetical protein
MTSYILLLSQRYFISFVIFLEKTKPWAFHTAYKTTQQKLCYVFSIIAHIKSNMTISNTLFSDSESFLIIILSLYQDVALTFLDVMQPLNLGLTLIMKFLYWHLFYWYWCNILIITVFAILGHIIVNIHW